MAMVVVCQHCGQRYSVREDLLGKQMKCKACGQPTSIIAAQPKAVPAQPVPSAKTKPAAGPSQPQSAPNLLDLLPDCTSPAAPMPPPNSGVVLKRTAQTTANPQTRKKGPKRRSANVKLLTSIAGGAFVILFGLVSIGLRVNRIVNRTRAVFAAKGDVNAELVKAVDEARRGNKKSLEISGDGQLDLSPLQQLPELESLVIDCGDVSDYRPLASLTNLKSLVLRSDSQRDLSPLASLDKLEVLDVTDGSVTDLSPFAGLSRLRELSFHWCSQLGDLGPLQKLSGLESLTLYECDRVTDLRPLAQCVGLKQLNLTDCFNIADVTPLSNLPNLRLLVLANTKVTDTSSLSKNANLKITFAKEEEEDGEENESF
jgi:hypothetical protein